MKKAEEQGRSPAEKKRRVKRGARAITAALLASCMLVPATVRAEGKGNCLERTKSNVEKQDYDAWTDVVRSNLTAVSDGRLMMVQADSDIDGVAVLYYDRNYRFQSKIMVPEELPRFGGFYETEDSYYLLTGQDNPEEDPDKEVFRVTKYDKSWNRISAAGMYDCDTRYPFSAGSARMTHQGKYLLIHTCRAMYAGADEESHQANITFQVDTEKMVGAEVSFRSWVSHSFNQFIRWEGSEFVLFDHGDAYPRAAWLNIFNANIVDGDLKFSDGDGVGVMKFPGAVGNNQTGAALGGLEIAGDYYLTAGSSVVQDEKNLERGTSNVFIASVDKETREVTMRWLTDYGEGDGTTSTPHLVKIGGGKYMVLWSRLGEVYYTVVDGTGKQKGDVYRFPGCLSDCAPLVTGDKLIWYTWDRREIIFYEISLSDLSVSSKRTVETGHAYECRSVSEDGYADLVCGICGASEKRKVYKSFYVSFYNPKTGMYAYNQDCEAGDRFYCYIYGKPWNKPNDVIKISVSDTEVLDVFSGIPDKGSVIEHDSLRIKKAGTAEVVFRSKYNPSACKVYSVTVTADGAGNPVHVKFEEAEAAGEELEQVKPESGFGWGTENGRTVWYEKGVKQGTYDDPAGVIGDGTVRGREIYDPDSDGWYWLDAVYGGAKACSKEVWMPYIYQNEAEWDEDQIISCAKKSGDMAAHVERAIRAAKEGVTDSSVIGKWVRYDENGKMCKGWYTVEGADAEIYPDQAGNTYYYDPMTGLMAKGYVEIEGVIYHFNEITGVRIDE